VAATRIYGLEQAVTGELASERGNFVDSDGVPLVRLPWRVDERLIPCARRRHGWASTYARCRGKSATPTSGSRRSPLAAW